MLLTESEMEEPVLLFCTVPDVGTARRLAHLLVEKRLAACVSYDEPVHSVYRWQGKMEEALEWKLTIKTVRRRFHEVKTLIVAHHPYDLPEIVCTPVTAGLPAYLEWIKQETA